MGKYEEVHTVLNKKNLPKDFLTDTNVKNNVSYLSESSSRLLSDCNLNNVVFSSSKVLLYWYSK